MRLQLNEVRFARSALLLATVTLAACAGPPPSTELRDARDAIERAQFNGAQTLAPQQLQMAQSKLSRADASVKDKDMDVAKNLALESEADADYANAVALVQKTAATEQHMQQLQQQLQQRQAAPQTQ